MKLNIHIQEDQQGSRLDVIVSDFDKKCSRNRAIHLINNSIVLVNNSKKKPGFKVKSGDIITGIIPESDIEPKVLPEKMDLDIIFEDDHIIVINKKPGVVVHPAPGNLSGTIVNGLLHHHPAIRQAGKEFFRTGIVHRLDKDTSGVMVAAKTLQAHDFLKKEFKQRRVEKKYLALVSGKFQEDQGQIKLPIARHPVKRKIMAINHDKGKPAITCWKVKKRLQSASLVEVLLKTGRTHQIRVHFYAVDHPLIGERIYQFQRQRRKKSIAQRQMLHASQITLRHPYSGRKLFFSAALPEDFIHTQSLLESF